MVTMIKAANGWLVVDFPKNCGDLPADLTQAWQRQGNQLPEDISELEPTPSLIALCARRRDARAMVRVSRNGGKVHKPVTNEMLAVLRENGFEI